MTPYSWWPPDHFRRMDSQNLKYRANKRKIILMKPKASPTFIFQYLAPYHIKHLKYLKRLNAFIGLFPDANFAERFKFHPDVFHVEEDIEVKILIPYKGKIMPKAQVIPWGINRIGADQVWTSTQGQNVRVAVLDTGIAFDHPDLQNNVKGGVNVLKPLLSPYDHNGHGTHVAGTIGAVNNQYGVVGVAPKVDLFAVKAFNKDGTAKLSDIIKGIDWCIENRMQIINMSFGFNDPSPTFKEAIIRAQQAGIVMAAASGNQGTRGRLEYPAQFPETIAVTSINEKNKISDFSTIGPNVDLAAPGEKIVSTWLNNSFRELSGTSMAVAHVSGVAALMLSKFPQLSSSEVTYYLKRTANKLKQSSYMAQGAGVVNARLLARRY